METLLVTSWVCFVVLIATLVGQDLIDRRVKIIPEEETW